jgi:hypothetical protein
MCEIKALINLVLCVFVASSSFAQTCEEEFRNPPQEKRPIMIWQWMDGVVTREGIRRDLEAFSQAGIGGVQNFQVGGSSQCVLRDTANAIGTGRWKELMRFAISECHRLGLSFGTHNCPGWSASACRDVCPELSMQKLVWSETVTAVRRGKVVLQLPLPEGASERMAYRDVAVVAVPAGDSVALESRVVLTDLMTAEGVLHWKKPHGAWRIFRFGQMANGKTNDGTAPYGGVGLECDKMSRKAVKAFWDAYPAMLVSLGNSEIGSTFRYLEMDSYEAGGQDWTELMPAEFQKRRGYEMVVWLPVVAGVTIGSKALSVRFMDDWRQTVTDLFAENYYGYMSELAHKNSLKLLVQPYATGGARPFNPVDTRKVVNCLAPDDPISAEFWTHPDWGWKDIPRVVDAARAAGHEIIRAEGFTCWPLNAWEDTPDDLKAIADKAFCLGINKLMLHAAAQNPWPEARPGMTFGMWGTQWTQGQTWWRDGARPLFTYFARCQTLLQRGSYVDDYRSTSPSLVSDNASMRWIHRRDGEADIYFVANTDSTNHLTTISIRGEPMIPEVWNPETGEILPAQAWQRHGGLTQVCLNLTQRQALFIVLRRHAFDNGPGLMQRTPVAISTVPVGKTWTVAFPEVGTRVIHRLEPWNEMKDKDMKYFSGTATYTTVFPLLRKDVCSRYFLDLGVVKDIAVVRVNGDTCAVLWRAPFRADITDALRKGDNRVEVSVTNLWVNRMVGDELEPDDMEWAEPFRFGAVPREPAVGRFLKSVPQWLINGEPRPTRRKAVMSFKFFGKDHPLKPAGMMGPVTLQPTQGVRN